MLMSYDLVNKKQSKKQIFNVPAQSNSESVKQKRSQRCPKLIRRLPATKVKKVLSIITDEKNFYPNPPVNRQNDCVWSAGTSAILKKIVWSLRYPCLRNASWFLLVCVFVVWGG